MNKMYLYVIHDLVACESGPLFESRNDGSALRSYKHMIETNKYAFEDFRLLKVGEIDHDTNILCAHEPREVSYVV